MTGQALKPYMLYEINMSRTKAVKEIADMSDLNDINNCLFRKEGNKN
jgi:hypothetical protein